MLTPREFNHLICICSPDNGVNPFLRGEDVDFILDVFGRMASEIERIGKEVSRLKGENGVEMPQDENTTQANTNEPRTMPLLDDTPEQRIVIQIWSLVKDELALQEAKWGKSRVLPIHTWMRIIGEEVDEFAEAAIKQDEQATLDELVDVCASAFSAIASILLAKELQRPAPAVEEEMPPFSITVTGIKNLTDLSNGIESMVIGFNRHKLAHLNKIHRIQEQK